MRINHNIVIDHPYQMEHMFSHVIELSMSLANYDVLAQYFTRFHTYESTGA